MKARKSQNIKNEKASINTTKLWVRKKFKGRRKACTLRRIVPQMKKKMMIVQGMCFSWPWFRMRMQHEENHQWNDPPLVYPKTQRNRSTMEYTCLLQNQMKRRNQGTQKNCSSWRKLLATNTPLINLHNHCRSLKSLCARKKYQIMKMRTIFASTREEN